MTATVPPPGVASVAPARRFAGWLGADYAPLDGRVRAVFYALVLVVGARFIAITVPNAVRAVPAELYDRSGLLGLVVDDRATAVWLVEALRFPVLVALVFAMVGLGGRAPQLVAGFGTFVVLGAYLGGTGTGHSWHVAVFAMVVLGLTHRPNSWSLDGVLAQRWSSYPFGRAATDRSAVGLKLILLYAVFTLFAGGCAKLLDGGWRWLDGASIQWFLSEHGAPKGVVGSTLTDWVLDYGWLAAAVSVLTVVIELGAVVTLVAPGTRLWYFGVLAAGFHLAIYLVMLPQFFPQLVTYVLLVEWARVDWRRPFALWAPRPIDTAPPVGRLALAGGGALAVVLAASIIWRIEWYPATNIPMYSSYVDGTEISGLPVSTFGEERLLCASRDSLRSSSRPWYVPIHLGDRLAVRQGAALLPVEDAARAAPGGPQFWQDELAAGLLDELACVDGKLAVDGTRTLRTVTALSDVLAAGPLTLVYRFDDAAVDVTTAEPDRSLARLRRHLGPLGRTLAHTAEAGP
ncbi:hypothetical protein BH18ACT2_BH18ACT2_04270 [soil metagenome]